MGDAYGHGECCAQSYTEAVKWYKVAASKGSPDALYNLAKCYQRGPESLILTLIGCAL